MNNKPVLGIIGGSGLYDIDGLQNTSWQKFPSAFGEPSDALLCGELNNQKLYSYRATDVAIKPHLSPN